MPSNIWLAQDDLKGFLKVTCLSVIFTFIFYFFHVSHLQVWYDFQCYVFVGFLCVEMCVFLCLYVYCIFSLALSLLTVSLLYPIMFLFILSYIMLLFLDACFCSNNREKERLWICVGGESGRSGKSWGRENHIHNIVYEKLFLSSQWIKGICY